MKLHFVVLIMEVIGTKTCLINEGSQGFNGLNVSNLQ